MKNKIFLIKFEVKSAKLKINDLSCIKMIKMKMFSLLVVYFISNILIAQEKFSHVINDSDGNVFINKDNRIDDLIKKKSVITPPSTSIQISGYRIQLFFDTDKKEVDLARSKFMSLYPNIETNIIYKAPNYFLKVGNFRTYLEAEKIKTSLDKDFPTNYILKELINLPSLN